MYLSVNLCYKVHLLFSYTSKRKYLQICNLLQSLFPYDLASCFKIDSWQWEFLFYRQHFSIWILLSCSYSYQMGHAKNCTCNYFQDILWSQSKLLYKSAVCYSHYLLYTLHSNMSNTFRCYFFVTLTSLEQRLWTRSVIFLNSFQFRYQLQIFNEIIYFPIKHDAFFAINQTRKAFLYYVVISAHVFLVLTERIEQPVSIHFGIFLVHKAHINEDSHKRLFHICHFLETKRKVSGMTSVVASSHSHTYCNHLISFIVPISDIMRESIFTWLITKLSWE